MTALPPEALIEARDLHYAFAGGIPALNGVDFAVPPGARVALLGANGAGKTTLLLHLNGSLKPARGTLRLDGENAGYDRAALQRWRARVGLVLQDPDDQLFAGTVYEDVSFGPLNLGLTETVVHARVTAALEALGIADLAARPVHMLSFGQKRRAAIAGIVAMRPRVLLLDEPTAGLDPHGVSQLLAALDALAAAGTALVLSTHDVDLAYGWAETMALMDRGRIIAQGPPEEALADDAALARAGLRRPLLMELAIQAHAAGLVTAGRLPRRAADLAAWLKSAHEGNGAPAGAPRNDSA